jgi:molybdate transport system ATP-binding protein
LFGPSGSGKTTVLSLIAGLLKPSSGFIRLGETVLTDTAAGIFLPPEDRFVGLLFQDQCLFPHLRVLANLRFGSRRRGGKNLPFDKVIQTLQLGDLLNRFPNSLSGGQRQRVALARAILSAPRILLLDEPLTSVEVPLQEKIVALIEQVVEQFQFQTLLVSHNRGLVDRLAKRIIQIEDGQTRIE